MASATSALWISWIFSKRWLDPEKRVAGLALLTLVPFFNFLAIRYNANAVLLPFWTFTVYCFLMSYSTRSLLFAALAGAGAGACMLGKYWSIFLIAGVAIAAIVDARRSAYFRSPAPWVTISAGLLVIAPHVVWLFNNHFSTFAYPLEKHGGISLWESGRKAVIHVLEFTAYIVVPLLFVWLAARPNADAIKDFFWPKEADARLASLAFWLPLALPILVALVLRVELTPIWTLPQVGLLPVVLLSSKKIVLARNAIAGIVVFAIILPVAALILSPGIAIANHFQGIANYGGHYRLLANEIEKNWRAVTNQPLRLVGSVHELAYGTAFYLSDRPSSLNIVNPELTPWADDARVKREGIALLCPVEKRRCMDKLDAFTRVAADSRRVEVTVARRYLGMQQAPVNYTLVLIVPESRKLH
jgi:hypothetical protein